MKVVTFNIRYDGGGDKGNNFEYRKPYILRKLKEESPDIVCFQEVMDHVSLWLTDSLPDYIVVGCGRNEDLSGEAMTIAFKKDKFSLMALNHFWHSETPHVPGSCFPEQSIFPRLCTECHLMDRKSKKVIRVINTHLDHLSSIARRKELEFVMSTINPVSMYNESLTILAGDFNAEPDSEEMKVMELYADFRCLTANIGLTYHGYFQDDQVSIEQQSPQIDYIYARGNVQLISVEKWADVHEGVYLSDHYPVSVVLEM